ncbi:MAG: hypothetical protein U5K69_27465 [Balneolaceae bacterium]|nr:hypothetical protein [Balneolaceae bacterium]
MDARMMRVSTLDACQWRYQRRMSAEAFTTTMEESQSGGEQKLIWDEIVFGVDVAIQ